MKQHRQLRLLGATRTFRTAKFEERDHLIVPTVMLVEGVIWPVNATFPELVLAEEFSKKPDSWNGRPLVPNHPDQDGKKVSANSPQILETQRFGQLFETKVKGKELWTESWIDEERVLKVSGASDLVERIKAGEPIEISTGTWLTIEDTEGEWNGKKFKGIWRDIVGDHLAMFPEGITGACSNEMGCGVRAAEANILTRGGVIHVRTDNEDKRTLRERLKDFLFRGAKSVEDMSDQDIRQELQRALFASEPAFMNVESVFPAEEKVVYSVMPDGKWTLFRRSFSLVDGKAKLGKDREEVEPRTTFETLAAACGCGGTMDKKDRIKALIENKKTPWTEDDRTYLEGLPEPRLKAAEENAQEVSAAPGPQPSPAPTPQPASVIQPTPQPAPAPAPEPEQAKELTEDEMLAKFPNVKRIVDEALAARAAEKNQLVNQLKASQKAYTETDLSAMDVAQLKKLSQLVTAKATTDFSARGPRVAEDNTTAPPPPNLADKLKALKQ